MALTGLEMFAIQGGASLLNGLFSGFGQSQQNAAAQKQADAINKANMQNWKYQNREMRRKFRYDTNSVKIQRDNIEQELAYNDETARKSWNYQMQIRAFDIEQRNRDFEQRKLTAGQQLGFNGIAYNFALQDADRWLQEQNIAMDFEEKSTMLDFRYNQLGEALKFQEADAARQQTRAMAQIEQQKTYVSALKSKGEAQARGGMGVTAEKAATASIAEAALDMSAIIQQVFNADQNFGLTSSQITANLEQINDKFYLDRAQIAASRVSASTQAIALKANAFMNKFQADMNAITSIGLPPSIPPTPPAPEPLPRPTLQDPFKPRPLPKPVASVPNLASPILAGLSTAIPGIAQAAVNAYAPRPTTNNNYITQLQAGGNAAGQAIFGGVQRSS
jgi:hypothetical protein